MNIHKQEISNNGTIAISKKLLLREKQLTNTKETMIY